MRQALARANPLVLLAVGGFSLLGSFFVTDLQVAAVAVGAYAIAAVLLLPTWRFPLVCLAFSLLAAGTVLYSGWRLGVPRDEALTQAARLVVLAWPGSVAIGFLDPARLADHLAQDLRVPARLAAAFGASLQRFTAFGHAWTELERVRRVRGVGPGRGPVSVVRHLVAMAFALLVHALRAATRSAVAMDARGFADAHHRTWAEPPRWTGVDRAGLAVGAGLGLVPVVTWLVTR